MRKPKTSSPESVGAVTATCLEELPIAIGTQERNWEGAATTLIGDVLDATSIEYPGRVLIRWRKLDGLLSECWLPVVRGLMLNRGDLVLLQRPANWHEWLVTNAIGGSAEHQAPRGRGVESG